MKKIIFSFVFLFLASQAHALDPYAPKENRKLGFVSVTTPLPVSDQITATHQASGKSFELKSAEVKHVPVGDYTLTIKLQSKTLTKNVAVKSTERTDVIIVGYGNLLVHAPDDAAVQVFSKGSLVGKYDAEKVYTLPTGVYEVVVKGKRWSVKQEVIVVTNTTREVEVKL